MTPRRRRSTGDRGRRKGQINEAARLTNELIAAGYTKKDVADILGRNSSIVSRFFTRGRGSGAAYVEALRYVVQEVQAGQAAGVEELRAIAAPYVHRRKTKAGKTARVRTKEVVGTPDGNSWFARAAKQHLVSGGSRLRPVIENTAAIGGKVAFSVRAKKSAFLYDAGDRKDSPGVRRNVEKRRDGTEERSYGNSPGAGQGPGGFDAPEWKDRVDAARGDVAAAVRNWLIETGASTRTPRSPTWRSAAGEHGQRSPAAAAADPPQSRSRRRPNRSRSHAPLACAAWLSGSSSPSARRRASVRHRRP